MTTHNAPAESIVRPQKPQVAHRRLRLLLKVYIVALLALFAGMLVALVALGGVDGLRRQLDAQDLVPIVQPEGPGETLLIIAPFSSTEGGYNTAAQRDFQRAIQAAALDSKLTNLRVARALTPLRADDRDGAEQLGARYNASLVVWGDIADERVAVSFLNRRGMPVIASQDVTSNKASAERLTEPLAYTRFTTDDLPQQLSFLSLFAIGQAHLATDKADDAIRALERAVDVIAPEATLVGLDTAYFQLGWLYHASGEQLEKAIAAYDQALKLQPRYAELYNNRGFARAKQGNLRGAIADFDLAIKLRSDYAQAYFGRGIIRFIQQDLPGALTDYNQAIKFQPNDAEAYHYRGNVRVIQGDLPGALADYSQTIKLQPNNIEAYHNRGVIRQRQGDLSGALADFDQAIKLQPDDATNYYSRGNIRTEQGNLADALEDFDQAIKLKPDHADAYINRAFAHLKLEDIPSALADLDQAIKLKPNDANAYYNRGVVHDVLGDQANALADFNQAIRLDYTFVGAYYSRGMIYKQQGDHDKAIADFEQVIRLTNDAAVRRSAEQLLRELRGQRDET